MFGYQLYAEFNGFEKAACQNVETKSLKHSLNSLSFPIVIKCTNPTKNRENKSFQ